ncbi:MAG: autotransporter-associated beta strand repeat-containing protein [Akkermansiaceae bacterium]
MKNLPSNPFITNRPLLPAIFLAGALVVSSLPAATIDKADNTDNLNLTTSWTGGVVPGAFDVAQWTGLAGANSTLLGGNLSLQGITIGTTGGLVTIQNGSTLTLGTAGINMSAATQDLTISSNLTLASGGQTWDVATGRTLTLNTGTFSRTAGAALNLQGAGTFAASMTSLTNTNSIIGPWATVGSGSSTRYATLSGGNLIGFTGGTAAAAFGWPSANNNTFNYDVAGVQGALGIGRQANTARYTGAEGTQNWGNNNTTTVTLNGLMNVGSGTLTFSEGGGTAQGQLAIGTNNGNELVLSAANANIIVKIPIINTGANAGSILVTGPGTVTVDSAGGASTYTGATTVASGTLLVNGVGNINSTSGIAINGSSAKYVHTSSVASTRSITLSQGSLDGTGTVGAVSVADNAANIVTNGNAGTTALTLGSLSFAGDATVNARKAGAASAGLAVTGALSTTPASGSVTVNGFSTGWSLGANNLITYGSFGGSIGDFTMGTFTGLSARQSADSLVLNGSAVALNVTGDLPVWTGSNGSAWTTATDGDNTGPNNWATKTAQTGTNFWAADIAEFNDTYNLGAGDVAVTNRSIDIQGANVSPGSVTFNHSTGDYTLASSTGHGIASGILSKSGTSKLTITTTNTYTGATTINAGTVQIGDGTTDGSIATSSGIANNGSLIYNLTANQSYGNAISGTGSVTKDGAATLTLSGNSSYQGGTTISDGIVRVGNNSALGTGAVDIAGGATVNNSATLSGLANTFTGSGAFTTGSGQVTLTGNWSGFSGTVTSTSTSDLVFNGGFSSGVALTTSENAAYVNNYNLNNTNGFIVQNTTGSTVTYKLGSYASAVGSNLRNAGSATGSVVFEIGNLNTDTVVAGGIGGGAQTVALTKVGNGKLTLAGTNNYIGATIVSAGTLLVNGSLANTAVSVNGGTLGGTGAITGTVSVANSATLSAGASIESLRTGALTMDSGSIFAFEAADNTTTGADLVAVNGSLSLTGVTLSFDLVTLAALQGGSWSVGNKLTLLSYLDGGSGITSGFTGYSDDTGYFFGANEWRFNYNDTVAGNNYGTDAISNSQNHFVTMTLVPEPGAALLGSLGMLALLRRRRS